MPEGKLTDIRKAVQAKDDESVVFCWIEWPDKVMNDPSKLDPRMDPEKNPMPFDGKRLIYGGFAPVVTLQK